MAGIYGPGRIPRCKQLQAGQPIAAPCDGYLNLVHVDDAARVVLAAEARASGAAVYCVADGQPVLRGEYYEQLARLIHAPPPVFAPPPAGSPALERAGSSKRVSNRRLLAQFDFRFQYPSYREGLAAIVRSAHFE
jgi:nucleoside-diphosphate-sugar epimerase